MSSPRPWGCFHINPQQTKKKIVFPTPVGVFLLRVLGVLPLHRLPHARGGVSMAELIFWTGILSSPRPWGCFYMVSMTVSIFQVFPTPVGVFPLILTRVHIMTRLPHARGGVSLDNMRYGDSAESSPRPWGCFSYRRQQFNS